MPLKLMLSGLEFALDNTRLRIGRADHLDVSISGDPLISSNHCVLDNTVLLDAASTNGTSINGQKIKHDTKVQLKHGDIIMLGETALYVVEGAPGDGAVPTAADGKPIEVSTKGGTGKQAKKKEGTTGGSKAASSARSKHKASHEREGSSSSASAAANATNNSTLYRATGPTVPNSPSNHSPTAANTTTVPPSAASSSSFNFIDQSRPLPLGPSYASSNADNSTQQRSSRPSANARAAATDTRLLDLSHASLDDSMNAEGLLDLSAPLGGRAGGEGQAGGDANDSAMELDEDSINISMDAAAARAILDPVHRINALNSNNSNDAAHPAAPPPPYQLPSPTASSAASSPTSTSLANLDTTRLADDGGGGGGGAGLSDSPQSVQLRKLQDALRESEVRAGRLERKLSHTQRRVSGAQVDANNRQASRVAELEGQVASLSYQLLYGAGPKDAEIQRLSDELSKARQDSDRHKEAATDAQRNGGVKQEQLSAEETAARAEKEQQALTAITEASSQLSGTRTELSVAVAEYGSQMNALLSLQQTLAAQQQLLVDASKTAPIKQEGASDGRDEAHQQLLSTVNNAAQSTATALTEERRVREEREGEWRKEFKSISQQLTAVTTLVNSLHDQLSTAASLHGQQLEGGSGSAKDKAAEASELAKRRATRGGEEESKQKDAPAAAAVAATKLSPALPSVDAASAVALQKDVSGLKSQVTSVSAQLQQVWAMVIALLVVSGLLLVLTRR